MSYPPPDDRTEGWKPDPAEDDPSKVRFWDGTAWTERVGVRKPRPPKATERWATWWVAGCVAVGVLIVLSGESCRRKTINMEQCDGFQRWAHDSGSGEFLLLVVIAAIAGGVLLGRIQDSIERSNR